MVSESSYEVSPFRLSAPSIQSACLRQALLVMLENVRPHGSLKELVIENYGGRKMAGWMGDSRLSNMASILLSNCIECEVLSPLSRLLFLQRLFLLGFGKLKRVGDELCWEESNGKSYLMPFLSLENLEFDDMYVWEEWKIIEGVFAQFLAYAD